MRLELYMVACSIIFVVLMRIHSYFAENYNGLNYLEQQNTALISQVDHRDLQLALLQAKDFENRQSLALRVPQLHQEDSYLARNIASVLSSDSIVLRPFLLEVEFEKAKAKFQAKDYLAAIRKFEGILAFDRSSVLAPEAQYLLIESYHNLNQREKVMELIHEMVRYYPESYLSGYALLRLGDLYKSEFDYDQAMYVYRYVEEKFSFDPQVRASASVKIQEVEVSVGSF